MKDDTFWVEDTDGQYTFSRKRKRGANKKLEFLGWGSRPLIEFLDSVGKDTSKPLTQHEVTTIIKEYIIASNLPLKKKRVQCDDGLHALFGKSVSRLKIYDALEKHFTVNHDDSEDEEDSSEEEDGAMLSGKGKKTATLGKNPSQGKMNVNKNPKSCFAAVVPENIKLVYLKKSLVLQLLEIPDDFEGKIKDSFVRIKSDRDDYLQKLPYHLEQVTGIKRVSEVGNGGSEYQLLVSNSITGVRLKMLSDDNFSEEECVDLRERIKAGLVKRPTVVELSAKAKILHQDIIKHWIPREIQLLQKLIDRANEKGWRKDLFEYLQRRQLLKTDAEQQRLLLQMPQVVAEELEQVDPPATSVDNSIGVEGNSSSPNSTLKGVSETSSLDASGMLDACNVPQSVVETGELDREDQDVLQEEENLSKGTENSQGLDFRGVAFSMITGELDREDQPVLQEENLIKSTENSQGVDSPGVSERHVSVTPVLQEENLIKSTENSQGVDSRGISERHVAVTPVIELSDDEEEPEKGIQNIDDNQRLHVIDKKPDNELQNFDWGPEDAIWYYLDPQNQPQGPFTVQSLKTWSDRGYFPSQFKIWMAGQNQDQAAFLADVIYHLFLRRGPF